MRNGYFIGAIILISLFGLLACHPDSQGDIFIIKGPYVQKLQQHSMTIMWENKKPFPGKVYYGKTKTLGSSTENADSLKIQKIILDGLEADTKYYYQIESNGFKSEINWFRTSVEDGKPFTFAAYGDNKNGPMIHEKLTNLILSYEPLFVSNNGDLIDRGRVYEQWDKLFFKPAKKMMARIPLVPAIGNHEDNISFYYQYFDIPKDKAWQSFDISGVHFIILNTEEEFLHDIDDQMEWLVQDLENKTADWTFVFEHIPPLTSGGNYYANSRIKVKNKLGPLFHKYKVDMVITGHDHHYERSRPIVMKGSNHAVTYIVGGNGGTTLRYIGKPKPFSLKSMQTHGFSLISIDGKKMTFKHISSENEILDEFVLDKNDPESIAEFMKRKMYFEDIFDPVEASKLYSKGRKLFKKKRYEEALIPLLKSYDVDPECEESTAKLSEVYYKLNNFEEAEKFALITIANAPLHPDPYKVMGNIFRDKKDYNKAIDWFKKMQAVQLDNPNGLLEIANIYLEIKDYNLAIETLKDANSIRSGDWEIHFSLAELYDQQGKKKDALAEYRMADYWFMKAHEDENHLLALKKIDELSTK